MTSTRNGRRKNGTYNQDHAGERGYVDRQPDAADRRKIYLRLTQAGRNIGDFANAQFRAVMTGHLARLTEGQLHDIALACRHLSTLFPEGLYEYEDACPVRPGV